MQRMLPIFAAAVVLTLAAPASAQQSLEEEQAAMQDGSPASAEEVAPSRTLRQIYQAELDSINAESTAATILYVVSPLVFIGGLALMSGGAVISCPIDFSPGCDGDAGAGAALMGVGGAVSLAALISFISAIVLDVESGSRRGALDTFRPDGVELTSVSVAPTEGGAALQLSGRF